MLARVAILAATLILAGCGGGVTTAPVAGEVTTTGGVSTSTTFNDTTTDNLTVPATEPPVTDTPDTSSPTTEPAADSTVRTEPVPTPVSADTTVAVPAGRAGDIVTAAAVLAQLTIAAEHRGGYDRDLFEHWSDLDRNGCDTRNDVLRNESLDRAQIDPYGCKVVAGTWYSRYDDVTTDDPTDIDIDHTVALAEAWDSGAWSWDADTRQRYANDLDDPRALIAVTSSSNRSKSADDHSGWLPTHGLCDYTADVLAVKLRWQLTIDPDEASALNRVITTNCPGLTLELPDAAVVNHTSTSATDAAPPVAVATAPAPPIGDVSVDPRYSSCKDAKAGGYGPYVNGVDIEYDWYRDGDSDGVVCE